CLECKREISTEAKSCPHCGKRNPTTSTSAAGQGCAGCLSVLAVLALIGMCSDGSTPTSTSSLTPTATYTPPPPPPSPKEAAMAATSLDFPRSKDGFESVMIANFRITNSSQHTIKDIEVT